MTEYDQELLLALWQLQEAHAASAPPDQPHAVGKARYRAGAQRWEWRVQAEHGPRIAALYSNGYNDAARKRATRALARLEGQGLVVLWGEQSNLTHCRLTPDGEKLARELVVGAARE